MGLFGGKPGRLLSYRLHRFYAAIPVRVQQIPVDRREAHRAMAGEIVLPDPHFLPKVARREGRSLEIRRDEHREAHRSSRPQRMSQHLGPSYTLSVLIVILCAIAFYRGERSSPPPRPAPSDSDQSPRGRAGEPRSSRAGESRPSPALVDETSRAPEGRPDRGDAQKQHRGGSESDVARGREDVGPRPAPGRVEPVASGSSTALTSRPPAHSVEGPRAAEASFTSVQGETKPVARPVARARPGPRGAFARVEAGETLADFARRVYGSAEKADDVWRANRDQLPSAESPPEAGMLLRTP
jgi:hypothetical protein